MKRQLFVSYLLILLLIFAGSCSTEPENSGPINLTIEILGKPQCNHSKSVKFYTQTPASQSCLEYAFDKDNSRLILRHLNAAFNCCPDSLWCTVVLRNDTISIQEFEKHKGCKCDCLYDLDIEISGIESAKYQVQLIEPYAEGQDEICFKMDLLNHKQGLHCVYRTKYPYGE